MPPQFKKLENKPISARDLSRVLGISLTTVGDLGRQGILIKGNRGFYQDAASIIGYLAYKERIAAERYAGRSEEARLRTALMREKLRVAIIEREFAEGKRVDIDEVRAALAAILSPHKTNLLAIGAKLAPQLSRLKTPTEMMATINREVEQCLHGVVAELSRLAKAR
jgi:phage terminase Nu1 subunit (DNA packaging protein)